jgi:mitochondrial fission protein ELM1
VAARDRAPATPPDPATLPRVWLLLGDKPGDNAQVEAVAEALEQTLGWTCERRVLHWRPPYATRKPRFRSTLDHLDPARTAALAPPWPDLVLTIGRRPAMAALWLKERAGGRTRLVLLGKPSGPMDRFDLVVAGAEVQLPPLPNAVPVRLPLMRARAADIAAAGAAWRGRLGPLARPLIGLLVGGPTVPFAFDARVSAELCRLAAGIAAGGGTPYVTTSRRTPAGVVAALRAGLPAAARLFAWTPEASDNPYLALLGLGDGFVVTGDSVSMIAEVVRARKPLAILDLPVGRLGAPDRWRRRLLRRLFMTESDTLRALVAAAYRARLLDATRDFGAFHRWMIEQGLAVRAGDPLAPPRAPPPDDLSTVVARIRDLIGSDRHRVIR